MTDTTTPPRERIVAGCMTGTSLDGLDAALVRIVGTGLDMTAEYLGWVSHPMDPGLRDTLMHLASGGAAEPLTYLRAARGVGELYADGVQHLVDETNGPRPEFVVAHGQTIWHAPRDPRKDSQGNIPGGGPKSWQLFDPWPVVRRHGVPVCYDLRQADLIAGGEGAPLTPLADWVMYRATVPRSVVNLGGVCNFTYIGLQGPAQMHAADTFACNLLIDGITQRLYPGRRYDDRGKIASSGKVLPFAREYVMQDRLRLDPDVGNEGCHNVDCYESLGREVFNADWIEGFIASAPESASPQDILCSAVQCVASLVPLCSGEVILAGGGARNDFLVDQIRRSRPPKSHVKKISLSDDLGIPCEAREAMGFAVLGALSQDGVPCSLPQVTGATDPGVAGVWAGV